MKELSKIKQYIIGIVSIIIIILLLGWAKDKIIVGLGGYTTQTITTTIDSTFVKGKIDTLEVFNHYVKTKGIILNPKAEIVYRYIKPDIKEDAEVIDSLKRYNVSIKDTLIEGNFIVLNNFKGDLISSEFKYKPLFPKYLIRVDTVKVINTTTKTLTNERSLLGLGVGISNLQYLSILGSYTTKKNLQIIYEYGKPLNKVNDIYNGVPIQLQQDDLHSIKIIKHF